MYASSNEIEVLKAEIAAIQQEAADVESKARDEQEACSELLEVVRAMESLALSCLDKGDPERARSIMQEKMEVQVKLDKASARVKDLITLEVKLSESLESKRSRLAEDDPKYMAFGDFRDEQAQVRITRDKDGNPTFERTGTVGNAPTEPPRPASTGTPSSSTPAYGSGSGRLGGTSFQDPWKSPTRSESYPAMDNTSGYMPSVDELLQEGDRKLDGQFLELERKLLEKALRASPDATAASERTPPPPPTPQPTPTPSRTMAATRAQEEEQKVVVSEWWTMGQNSLMEGALAPLLERLKPEYEDAARALIAVTNARIRGEDPSPQKLLSLIALCLRPPAQHDSGIFWGVQTAAGAAQLSDNIRLAIYGAALQAVVVDLLGGGTTMIPEEVPDRGIEGRALLVALASAVGLKSAAASDFSVRLLCRACRTCLLNSVASLRQAYATEERTSMDRAEEDLRALFNLLSTLPMALPLAMGHAAAAEVTEQLRAVVSPVDARRLDKLYRVVSGDDGSSASLRALLEPIFEDLD